jgi:integrase/recombinase XerD
MTLLAPTLQAFFTERLMTQREASPHTISGYRDTMRLLLCFATEQTGKPPSRLEVSDLDARLISAFLDHLEHDRHNTARTRNVRLAAIRSLFRYAALRHPEHADVIARVLAIPAKRFDRALINFLTTNEVKALLAAPDRNTWTGRRDHALLLTAIQTGLRVSELTGLRCQDVRLGPISYLFTQGKNRKQRTVPLTSQTIKVLRVWLKERRGQPQETLFPTTRGGHSAATPSNG